MSIISKNKINKIKRNLEGSIGKQEYTKFIIKAKDGLFLFDLSKNPFYEDIYIPIEKELQGLIVEDCSKCLIENIIVAGNGKSEPVIITMDDLEEVPEELQYNFKDACINNPSDPFSELTTEELKVLANIKE